LNDPFTFYYSYYLPSQAAQAMRPTPLDTINAVTAQRQYYAATQRRALYNPISPYQQEEFDPLRPFSEQRGSERRAQPFRFVQDTSNSDGTGPSLYFGRAAQYFPGLPSGRGPNANVSTPRRSTRRGGGMGMGGMGMGGMGMGGMGMGGMGMGGMGMGGMGMPG
jgi:hypothetical protein